MITQIKYLSLYGWKPNYPFIIRLEAIMLWNLGQALETKNCLSCSLSQAWGKETPSLPGRAYTEQRQKNLPVFSSCRQPFHRFSLQQPCSPAPAGSVFVLSQDDSALHDKLMIRNVQGQILFNRTSIWPYTKNWFNVNRKGCWLHNLAKAQFLIYLHEKPLEVWNAILDAVAPSQWLQTLPLAT